MSTLLVEILSSRLLSVVTWYHVSFFAVSLAMLGMAAGAVSVFVLGDRLIGPAAARALARVTLAFSLSIPLCHVASLVLPMPVFDVATPAALASAVRMVVVLTAPFYLSGVAVALALTRLGRPIGRLYAMDLFGAAAGCLVVIPLLSVTNITAATFATASAAALAAVFFQRFSESGTWVRPVVMLVVMLAATALTAARLGGVGVVTGKDEKLSRDDVLDFAWNTYSHVIVQHPKTGYPYYWGPGEGARGSRATTVRMAIDAGAITVMTGWNGDVKALDWVRHDITYLPYSIRQGDAAVIGVGGGRDVLSAIAAGCRSITGIEMNGVFIDWLEGSLREFSGIADRPEVLLVNDEARSYLARTEQRFDVIQMSLIDTWASTGAGAFALSENGLYTVESWDVFLDALKPGGVLNVSRWFSPTRLSETNRLLALGAAVLLRRGHSPPADHMLLVAIGKIATLLISDETFDEDDLQTVQDVARSEGFQILLGPGQAPASSVFARIAASTSLADLEGVIADPSYDYSPPTDERPYFFNILRPAGFLHVDVKRHPGVVAGNLRATRTLITLVAACVLLVALIVLGPLLFTGRPAGSGLGLGVSFVYFAGIGAGYMLCQFALLQRFVVVLGHPTYSLAVVLFTMILFTGLGSYLSDRIDIGRRTWLVAIPLLAGGGIGALVLVLPGIVGAAAALPLAARVAVVVTLTAPLATLLGLLFPLGMRAAVAVAPGAGAWMWGINGAFSVLGSVGALAVSMWSGIDTTLTTAALIYALLALALPAMRSPDYLSSGARSSR